MATTTSADATGTEKTTTSPLPQDAQASEPTDAKGTVDDRTVTGDVYKRQSFTPAPLLHLPAHYRQNLHLSGFPVLYFLPAHLHRLCLLYTS